MWPIITWVTLGLMLVDGIGFAFLSLYEEDSSVSSVIKARRIAKIIALVEINVLNLLFVFIPMRLIIDLITVITANLLALFYLVWDLIYLSERKKEYILWLQKIVFSEKQISSVFDIKEDDGGNYVDKKKFRQQRCSIVKQANEKYESIKLEWGPSVYYLVPKHQLSIETLTFYCLKIEFDMEKKEKLRVYSQDINPVAIKEYENGGLSKIYLFIKYKLFSPKGKTIIQFSIVGIFMIVVISILICINFGMDPFEWMSKPF